MNKARRKQIKNNIYYLNTIKDDIELILSDEEFYLDNIPENLQNSIRAEESEEAIENMQEIVELLTECIDSLNNII